MDALEELRQRAAGCTSCDLYKVGTQTVFGEGAVGAEVMLVGEQPGDQEDRQGRPFVGPAGRLLDQALADVGMDRGQAYVTNVVKHFRWTPGGRGGKVRVHKKPTAEQVKACGPWLEAELEVVRPKVVVCMGATAAQALLGPSFRVTTQRGQWVEWPFKPKATATVHPSSILRAPDEGARRLAYSGFVADLRVVAESLGQTSR